MGSNLFMEMPYLSWASVTSMENGHLNIFALPSSVEPEEVVVNFFNVKEDGQRKVSINMFQKVG